MDYKKLDLPNTNYPNKEQLEAFKTAFDAFLETKPQENENHQNDAFNDLLKGVFKYKVKPIKKIDSAILNDNNKVEVIIEFKALKNPNEFIKKGDLNVKAFHESLLYYLTERKEGNNNLKHLILATIKELYIIDANEFEVFNKDKEIKKAFENCHDKKGNDPRTKAFYDACQKRLNELDRSLKYHHIPLKKENLALIYQALSPNFLLKIPKYSDANTLNKDFYEELLYILGLEEQNEKGKILIKPILRGKDIKRYSYEWAGEWVIFIPWHFPNTDNPKNMEENEQDFSIHYPIIYAHLLSHKDKLLKRNKDETGKRYEWYCLQRWAASYLQDFEKEKIVYGEIVQEPRFYLDNGECELGFFYAEATSFILTGEHLRYLLGMLHSKLITFAFKTFYAGGGLGESGYRYKKAFIERLPIPQITEKNQELADKITDGAKQILALKEKDPKVNTQRLEKEIDALVYRLYHLTDEEIKIIEEGQ
ncbi:hypothetical protein C2R73_05465 [Helicobacter pylori]|nr:TaqI-like C-terminal specificity domain-containing protein [Helicobacter pylori]PUD46240.1 hypothetical protein C2R73_05465 [Helicobacter pylori]WRG69779.1 hypothetical protein FNE13_07620 [Helicobacter pylori]